MHKKVAKKRLKSTTHRAGRMSLGEKTTVLINSEKPIERKKPFNTPKGYRILIYLRTCPFESHVYVFIIESMKLFYPIYILVDLYSSSKVD